MAAVTVGSCTLRCCTQVLRKDMGGSGQAEAIRQTCRQPGEGGCSFPTSIAGLSRGAAAHGLATALQALEDVECLKHCAVPWTPNCIAGIRVAASAVQKALLHVKAAHQSKGLPALANR